ncbi:MAG: hypothetical protein J1F67_11970 [Muribaculaceae bacterium]|nr:hypothetical protein [Muribaculaceae bacterium]
MFQSELINIKAESLSRLSDSCLWLKNKEKALYALYEECKSPDNVKLIEDLIQRFTIIREEERNEAYWAITEQIKRVYIPHETLVIAMTKGGDADSSQKVIHELKSFLEAEKIFHYKQLNHFNLSPKNHKKYKCFILVDEFMGSGKTVVSRYNEIKKIFPDLDSIHFFMIAAMDLAMENVKMAVKDISIYSHYVLKQGINCHYSEPLLTNNINTMLAHEACLSSQIGSKELKDYSLGYNNAQALVAFGDYNLPNSVFPVFWWPNDDFNRKTLFTRYEPGFH